MCESCDSVTDKSNSYYTVVPGSNQGLKKVLILTLWRTRCYPLFHIYALKICSILVLLYYIPKTHTSQVHILIIYIRLSPILLQFKPTNTQDLMKITII